MNLPDQHMGTITEKMKSPLTGMLAFFTGSTVTVTEIVTSGSLWLTFGGALLAFLGGLWALLTARLRYKAEWLKLEQAKIEFARAQDLGNGRPKHPQQHHHRR